MTTAGCKTRNFEPVPARSNPFATRHVHAVRYEVQDGTWSSVLDRLEALDFRAAVVGPHGSGKTTFLEDLNRHLQSRGHDTVLMRLGSEGRVSAVIAKLRRAPRNRLALLDSAGHVGAMRWWRLWRHAKKMRGIVITAHQPCRLPTLITCDTSAELLDRIVHRIARGRFVVPDGRINEVYGMAGGNIREAIRILYDSYALAPFHDAPQCVGAEES